MGNPLLRWSGLAKALVNRQFGSFILPRLQRLTFSEDQFQAAHVTLNSQQQRYLLKVLRLKAGDNFIAMDGRGHWWQAELAPDERMATLLDPIDINNELPIAITLVASPAKGKGFDEVIHSVTELGVSEIYPLLSERTVVHPSPQKIERWQKIASEATEQSLRQFIPTVHSPVDLRTLAAIFKPWSSGSLFFGSTQAGNPTFEQALRQRLPLEKIAIVTGPEGGWSPAEEMQLCQMQGIAVSLGRRILRAVTAPVCAMSIAAAIFERAEPNP